MDSCDVENLEDKSTGFIVPLICACKDVRHTYLVSEKAVPAHLQVLCSGIKKCALFVLKGNEIAEAFYKS